MELFKDIFKKVNDEQIITYETTILDPFLSITKPTDENPYNLDNLYDWYLTKNTSFIEKETTINDANPKVPEFKTLIALIIKDIILLYITKKFPSKNENDNENNNDNNKKLNRISDCDYIYDLSGKNISDDNHNLIIELLKQIEDIITNGYNYLQIINLIINYYKLFNFGYVYLNEDDSDLKNEKDKKECLKLIESLRNLSNTCFMIYPSFAFINYTKILYFMQAPVLILKMANIRENTDNIFMSPIFQIWHDISFHADITQCVYREESDKKMVISLYKNENNQYDIFKKKFNVIKKYINVNYKNLNDSNFETSLPERKKYFIAYILFLILHELEIAYIDELNRKCTILYFHDFEESINKILEKPEITKESRLKKPIIHLSNKDKIIKMIIKEFQTNEKEITRFTLIPLEDPNNIQTNITKSYDVAKVEIDKLFEELRELQKLEQHPQMGGEHNKKTKKQKTNKTKNNKHNKHNKHNNYKIKKKSTKLLISKTSKPSKFNKYNKK